MLTSSPPKPPLPGTQLLNHDQCEISKEKLSRSLTVLFIPLSPYIGRNLVMPLHSFEAFTKELLCSRHYSWPHLECENEYGTETTITQDTLLLEEHQVDENSEKEL